MAKFEPQYSEEYKQRIVDDYLAGATTAELRAKYGHRNPTLYRWFKQMGISLRKAKYRNYTPELIQAMAEDYLNGLEPRFITKKYAVDRTSLTRVLRKNAKLEEKYKHKYPPEFKQAVIEDYLKGYTPKELAEAYGFKSPRQVFDWL